ncbi:MAG: hypothetical protein QOF90_1018 [Acetobacteraceae bacterium]|nr:hypothetical protein [Acetobacteraceae bacterium]
MIPSDSGGYGGARIKSGHDGEGMDCPCPDLILMPMGPNPHDEEEVRRIKRENENC